MAEYNVEKLTKDEMDFVIQLLDRQPLIGPILESSMEEKSWVNEFLQVYFIKASTVKIGGRDHEIHNTNKK